MMFEDQHKAHIPGDTVSMATWYLEYEPDPASSDNPSLTPDGFHFS